MAPNPAILLAPTSHSKSSEVQGTEQQHQQLAVKPPAPPAVVSPFHSNTNKRKQPAEATPPVAAAGHGISGPTPDTVMQSNHPAAAAAVQAVPTPVVTKNLALELDAAAAAAKERAVRNQQIANGMDYAHSAGSEAPPSFEPGKSPNKKAKPNPSAAPEPSPEPEAEPVSIAAPGRTRLPDRPLAPVPAVAATAALIASVGTQSSTASKIRSRRKRSTTATAAAAAATANGHSDPYALLPEDAPAAAADSAADAIDSSPKQYRFLFSGFDEKQRSVIESQVMNLAQKSDKSVKVTIISDAEINSLKSSKHAVTQASAQQSSDLYQSATHLVASSLKRSEKVLLSVVGQKWCLTAEWVAACVTAGRFVDEAAYSWGGAPAPSKPGEKSTDAVVSAIQRWPPLALAPNGESPFTGYRVFLHSDPKRELLTYSLLTCGKATVHLLPTAPESKRKLTADEIRCRSAFLADVLIPAHTTTLTANSVPAKLTHAFWNRDVYYSLFDDTSKSAQADPSFHRERRAIIDWCMRSGIVCVDDQFIIERITRPPELCSLSEFILKPPPSAAVVSTATAPPAAATTANGATSRRAKPTASLATAVAAAAALNSKRNR